MADAASIRIMGLRMSHREIITQGDLPHWYVLGAAHFVTYRLADSLPAEVLKRLRAEREAHLDQPTIPGVPRWKQKAQAHKQFFAAYGWDWPYCSSHDRRHPRDKRLAEWW